ncbi:HAMP domain-containing histidine kinase [Microbacterium trichothecenolyticum]|uniref:sensor histidine kinase n=1 Tax=Microbacterium trichothecenolyticum TaxID=69370 RepID=UPI001C6E67F7|nr:HAMP domain-containing sensor histidine kinase [Microbacterium trichothecenolyticum]MBW9120690.1 HAMP domain-containing histidine kinase [Microbacterium trichothecenolyticum]
MTAAKRGEPGRPAARSRMTGAMPDGADRTRGRTATLNQLLLAAVVFVLGVLVAVGPFGGEPVLFFLGVVLVIAVTAVTLVVPWNSLPYGWVAIVPAIDIVAITLMQIAAPDTVLGLLWIFPATWLAGGFGLLGLFGVIVAIAGIVSVLTALSATEVTYRTFLLPLVIIAVAVTSHLNARRSDAQRMLLAKQSQLLASVLARTRRQEQVVTEVLDAVDFGVVRMGASGRVAVTNEAHGRLLQGFESDHDGTQVPAFRDDGTSPLPPDELPLERARRGEAFDDQVVWFGPEPGPRRALTITARRLTDSDGGDAGAVVVSRDVTTELNALRARDDLVASVSHELRTPLTSILGYLDLAIEDPDTPDAVRASLDVAERNAERLLRIVADILAASSSSPSSVEASLAPQLLDARDLVRAATADALPRAAARAIIIDETGLEPATAWADPLRLRQVVDNLVSNAIAYNKDGGTVFVGTTTDGTSSWILVRDTGVGISDADRSRLFQRYYKAGGERRSGTGLGLAITRDIVRAHGGELALHSAPGVGSTFIVKLPANGPEGEEG